MNMSLASKFLSFLSGPEGAFISNHQQQER